jgi:hypothetical protein
MSDKKTASNTEGNLDITQLGNDEHDALASAIEDFYKQDTSVKIRLSYNWDRNHRFLDGDQWVVFDGDRETGGQWRRVSVSKANEYIPRPVTNYIYDVFQTLKSYLIKNKPRSSVRPNTQSFRDKSAAKVGELVLEANWERLNEQANYEYAAACLLVYGTVFKKSYWDTSTIMMARVPRTQMQPQIDPNTGDVIGEQEAPVINPETGEQEVDELPLGDVNTDIVEPYRIALDPLATDLHKARWIMEYSIQSLDWIRETYGKEGDGYTGRIDEVLEEKQLSGSMRRFYQLKNSSGVRGAVPLEGGQGGSSYAPLTNSAVVKEYYEKPSAKHPKGRMVIVANGITLYSGPNPCDGPDMLDWHPYSECRWEIVPGRFWGKSPLDPACEIQKHINSIDSTIILTRKTMAVPQKLVPAGAGIPDGAWTGRPGQQINYRESGGSRPEIIPGVGVDAMVFQERAQRVSDLKEVTGAVDILKGDRPPGVNAASALAMLYEVGTGKIFPTLDRWKRFVECDQKKQLRLTAKHFKEPRPSFIQLLKSKNQDLSEETINKFIGADLYDNCNVIVEAGSNIPKLQAAQQARLQEAAQVGTLNLELPSNRMEYNRQMGIAGFDNDVGPDVKRAEWENDLMDNANLSPDNRPIRLEVDDDRLHMEIHARRMKEPSFLEAAPEVQQVFMEHYQEHMDSQSQKQQAQAMEAMASGQQAMPEQSGADQQQISSRGRGAPRQAREALLQDVSVPAQLGGS